MTFAIQVELCSVDSRQYRSLGKTSWEREMTLLLNHLDWAIEELNNDEVRMSKVEAEWRDLTEERGVCGQLIGSEVARRDGWLWAVLKAQGGVSWRMRFWCDYILAVEWLGVWRNCNQRKGPGLRPRLGWWLLLEGKDGIWVGVEWRAGREPDSGW